MEKKYESMSPHLHTSLFELSHSYFIHYLIASQITFCHCDKEIFS